MQWIQRSSSWWVSFLNCWVHSFHQIRNTCGHNFFRLFFAHTLIFYLLLEPQLHMYSCSNHLILVYRLLIFFRFYFLPVLHFFIVPIGVIKFIHFLSELSHLILIITSGLITLDIVFLSWGFFYFLIFCISLFTVFTFSFKQYNIMPA